MSRSTDTLNGAIAQGVLHRLDPAYVYDLVDAVADEGDWLLSLAYRGFFDRALMSSDHGAADVADANAARAAGDFRARLARRIGAPPEDVASAYDARDIGDRSTSDALELRYFTR